MNLINQIIIGINILSFLLKGYNPFLFYTTIYSPFYILNFGQYSRMITHAFSHANLPHLFINMLVYYQITENPLYYNLNIIKILFYYFIIYNALFLFTSWILLNYFNYAYLFYSRGVGFSGVIFCLKYLTNLYNGDQIVNAYGINIQRKYFIFLELLISSLILPNVSFEGHLFGILTGIVINYFNLTPIFV